MYVSTRLFICIYAMRSEASTTLLPFMKKNKKEFSLKLKCCIILWAFWLQIAIRFDSPNTHDFTRHAPIPEAFLISVTAKGLPTEPNWHVRRLKSTWKSKDRNDTYPKWFASPHSVQHFAPLVTCDIASTHAIAPAASYCQSHNDWHVSQLQVYWCIYMYIHTYLCVHLSVYKCKALAKNRNLLSFNLFCYFYLTSSARLFLRVWRK